MQKIIYKSPKELALFHGKDYYATIQKEFIAKISNKQWRDVIHIFYTMPKPESNYKYKLLSNWDFEVAPGSGAHQAHFGGLALHTLQDLEYAEALAKVYERRKISINYDLLYTTIALHDTMKRFIYEFDDNYVLQKAEDPFIAKEADHHSLILHEMTKNGCDKELILSVAAIHGIDDVTLSDGVNSMAVVNHYLKIGQTGLKYTVNDICPEHVIAFLSDSDWYWSGQAQIQSGILAGMIAGSDVKMANYLKLYIGSRFTYEKVGSFIHKHGYTAAKNYFLLQMQSD